MRSFCDRPATIGFIIGAMVLGTTLLLTTEANIGKTDAAQCGFLTLGMAALAIVILGISVPRMIDSTSTASSGGFRGTVSPAAVTRNIRIILIQSPSGFQQALANVGDFESGMISSATSSDSITGPRILVDFATSTITALNASNEKIHTAPLPKDAEEISAAIATAVSRL